LFSDVTASNFFKTDEEFIAALGQAYSAFGGIGNHFGLFTINELASDELVICTKGGDWYDGGVLLQMHRHNYVASNGLFNSAWGFCYGGVNTCNRLISQFKDLGTPEADAFIAELRAVRALWYYWLVDAFGNIPLVVDFKDVSKPATKSRQEVFAFIESELKDVINVLPTKKDASTYGRMTKWAALAIQCKLYLNAGVFTGSPQWQKAADAANEIINNGGFTLETSYKANFAVNNAKSRENIL
jgi:hypothetical protein